jgi:hypothetical protein
VALVAVRVVRVPCGALCEAAILPLEIRRFDAPWAEVYRAASDIVHADDAFGTAAKTLGREVGRDDGVDGAT